MWLHLSGFLLTLLGCTFADPEDYITYHPGTLPIILGAPHGGYLKPEDVPHRGAGCYNSKEKKCIWVHGCGDQDSSKCRAVTGADVYTKELSLLMRQEIYNLYGEYPHVIINELHRSKLDANRKMDTATLGVPSMEVAWTEFHTYINQSKAASTSPSLYFDIHGHGHPLQHAELGYLIKGPKLDSSEFSPEDTSIRRLSENVDITFEELLRGKLSFGAILEEEGYEAVPSKSKPGPDGEPYYSGGDNTRMHGSRSGGNTDAIQIESPSSFRSEEKRGAYAKALAKSIKRYMEAHYGFKGNSTLVKEMEAKAAAGGASSVSSIHTGVSIFAAFFAVLYGLCKFEH